MNYDEIKSKFYKAVENPAGWQHISHFFKKIKAEDTSIVLDVLLSIFIEKSEKNSQYDVQEVAGGCLWKLKPPYRRQISQDIRDILENWNVSVEELPWYLADQIGVDVFLNEIKSLLDCPISEKEKKKLDTILYWIDGRDRESFKKNLNEKWKKIRG